jgi:MYXO-CTERM domain-containing protein
MIASRWLRVGAAAMFVGGLTASCSSAEPSTETLATNSEAITSGCNQGTIGLPCDPDGMGPLQECEGVCALRPAGGGVTIACVTLATAGVTSNNGKICGSSGASDCSKSCLGKLCTAIAAPDGTACRPTSGGSIADDICDGQCKSGACVALATTEKCPANTVGDCVYNFCSATASKTCVNYPLPKGYTCNDASSCTTGDSCDGLGKCVGTTKACPTSGTPCLVNACDPTTTAGTCIAKPQTGAACAFDKCFAGTCSSTGTCVKGTEISCDDSDACTTDSCDATTGCAHDAKVCPGDACSIPACDKTTGACSTTPKSCDDSNPCTTDSCDATTGCKNTPIPGCTFFPDGGGPDTAPPPLDTGVVPVDTGVAPVDTGVIVDEVGPEEDTGSPFPEDASPPIPDTAVTDSGDDAGSGIEETVDSSGCGCRTTSSAGTPAYAALSLAALGLVFARRRRSA